MDYSRELILFSIGILLIWCGTIAWLTVRRDERRWDLLCATLLAGIFLVFFWRTVSGVVFRPGGGGDLASFLFPIYRFAARTLNEGRLPLWNPHLYGGAPFIGDIQSGFLYPPNLLLFLLNPSFDYHWMQLLGIWHLWWAGLGVFVLARTLGCGRSAALLAGVAFGLSDHLFMRTGNLNLIAVLSWTGWILAACHLAFTRHSLVWAGCAAALFAIANSAGHAQSSYHLCMAVGVYSAGVLVMRFWESLAAGPRKAASRQLLIDLRYPLTVFILAALLSAPILLPAFEMLPYTHRAAFEYQDSSKYSLPPGPALVGLFTPSFFGRGSGSYWGSPDRVEMPYAGLVTLLLAAGALLLPAPGKWRRLLPWFALAVFAFVVALGRYTPVHGWLTQILPVYDSLRAPARAIVLWALTIAVLAAIGLDALLEGGKREEEDTVPSYSTLYFSFIRIGVAGLPLVLIPLIFVTTRVLQEGADTLRRATTAGQAVLLATFVWLATWLLLALHRRKRLKGSILPGLLLILLLVELSVAGVNINMRRNDGTNDPTRGFEHPEIVSFLKGQSVERTDAAAGGPAVDSSLASHLFRIDARTGIYDLWQPNTAALAGFWDVWGTYNPLILTHWEGLWENNPGRHTRIYDMYNVRFVIVRDGTPLDRQYSLAYDAPGPLAVYENPDPLPRAWLVPTAQVLADEEAVLAALKQPSFEPLHVVIMAQQNDLRPDSAASAVSPSSGLDGPVSILAHSENEIVLAVHAERAGILVLSEVWFPGWLATVNGEPAPVWRANYTFRALPVPAGELEIRLWYAPDSWHRGLALFGVGFLLLTGLSFWRLIDGKKTLIMAITAKQSGWAKMVPSLIT